MTIRNRVSHGVAGGIVLLALTSCEASGKKPTAPIAPIPSPIPMATTASPDPSVSASTAALSTYNRAVAEWVHAGTTADNHDPHLADYATGQALTSLQLSLASAKSANLHFDGAPKDDPQVKQLLPPTAPTQVFIVSCMDATNWISRKADGSVADTGPNGKHRIEALVAESSAGWKVTRMMIRAAGTC